MTGPVSDRDYSDILVPAIDEVISTGGRVRRPSIVEAGLSELTLGAVLQDARLGSKHWRGFERAAVVTGNPAFRRRQSTQVPQCVDSIRPVPDLRSVEIDRVFDDRELRHPRRPQ
jgi:hypothetical protein